MTYRAAMDEFARELRALAIMRASWRHSLVRIPNPISIRISVPPHSHPPPTARLAAAIPVGTGEGTGSSVRFSVRFPFLYSWLRPRTGAKGLACPAFRR